MAGNSDKSENTFILLLILLSLVVCCNRLGDISENADKLNNVKEIKF